VNVVAGVLESGAVSGAGFWMDRETRSPATADLLSGPFTVIDGGAGEADGPEWQERALCAQTDPEAFFPEKGGSTREAKRICSGCDVRAECLEYALAHDERFGIWGGLSERERRRLRRGELGHGDLGVVV
jgi:WhiB family redox-sensing transcriptional regulator